MSKYKTLLFLALSIICMIANHLIYKKFGVVNVTETTQKQIGAFTSVKNDVYRKHNNKLLWLDGVKGDSVFANEAIKTNSKSSSKISLNNGSSIVLEENTMIVLNQESNSFNLDILDGKVFLESKNKEPIKINNGKEQLEVTGTVLLSKTKEKSTIQVIDGEVKSNKIKIKSGESLETTSNKTETPVAQVKKNTFSDLLPKNETNLNAFEMETVSFSWKKTNNQQTTLLIGEDPNNLKEYIAKDKNYKLSLHPGTYFWKIQDSSETSPLFNFKINKIDQISALSPSNTTIYNNPSTISFNYNSSDNCDFIEIQYSNNDQFENSKSTKDNSVSLNKGTYYWRVKQKFQEKIFYSNVQKFQVEEKIKDVEITLMSPSNEIWVMDTPKLNLKWNSNEPARVSKWKLTVSQKNKIKDFYSTKNEFSITLKDMDQTLLNIQALDQMENIIGTHQTKFDFKKVPEPIFPVLKKQYTSDNTGSVLLDANESYETCFLTIQNNFYTNKIECGKDKTLVKNLMPGTYKLSVQVTDIFNRTLTNREPASIFVPKESNISAPKLKKMKVK